MTTFSIPTRILYKKTLDINTQSVIINYMKFIDITPKWEAVMQILVEILTNPKASTDSKREAKAELIDLARWVDKVNEERKKK